MVVCVVVLIVTLGVLGLATIIRSCVADQDVEKTTRMKLEQHLNCTYSNESRQMLCYPADE